MYLEILPNGNKFWRFRFRQTTGKENLMTFGPYPEVSLAHAREKRSSARRLLSEGIDPAKHRDAQRREAVEIDANTFEKMAREWHGVKETSWPPDYACNVLHRLEIDIFPALGKRWRILRNPMLAHIGPLTLALSLIDEDPMQPRTKENPGFSGPSLSELAASIALRGVKTPISVRDNPGMPGRFIVNHGARRVRASRLAENGTIPAFVDNDYNEADQVVENLHRNALTAREIADFIGRELAKRAQEERDREAHQQVPCVYIAARQLARSS
jgi:hypothetical protein